MKNIFMMLVFSSLSVLAAKDVFQWRGNDRTGVYPETGLLKSWPEGGPKMLWSNEDVGGEGYSNPSIVGDKLYLTATSEDKKRESLFVLDRATGKALWNIEYGRSWDKSFQEARTMPYVQGDNIFVTSGAGEVVCIDAKSKKIKWSYDAVGKHGGRQNAWGFAENPLVWKDKIFYIVGGESTSIIALNAKTGDLLWKSKVVDKKAAYISPVIVMFENKPILIGGLTSYLFGVNPDTGELLWSQELRKLGTGGMKKQTTWEINVTTPIYKDGKFFVTAGYDYGSFLFEIQKGGKAIKELWSNAELDNHHGGVVLIDGKLYGSNWDGNENGNWICVDWNTGKTVYDEAWKSHSKGSVASADGMLYIYEEKRGDIALVNPKSEKFDIVSTFKVPLGSGRHWCHIVVCDGVMYVRHGKALMAYNVKQ